MKLIGVADNDKANVVYVSMCMCVQHNMIMTDFGEHIFNIPHTAICTIHTHIWLCVRMGNAVVVGNQLKGLFKTSECEYKRHNRITYKNKK